jgi:hypothetical protein
VADFEVTGTGSADLAALQKRLYAISRGDGDKTINGMLRKRLREQMAPAKALVQQSVLAIPSGGASGGAGHSARGGKSGRSTGLRQRISQLVTATATTTGNSPSVKIAIRSGGMPAGQGGLPMLMEGKKPWRHPVYGTSTWVGQSAHPYFFVKLNATAPKWRAAVLSAMKDVAVYVNSRTG